MSDQDRFRTAAQDLDRENPEVRAARADQGGIVTERPLEGQKAFVTGASSGLGRRFATTLARAGAKVALAARRTDRLKELAQAIGNKIGRAHSGTPVTNTQLVCRRLLEKKK